jgi:hypothetical protein
MEGVWVIFLNFLLLLLLNEKGRGRRAWVLFFHHVLFLLLKEGNGCEVFLIKKIIFC